MHLEDHPHDSEMANQPLDNQPPDNPFPPEHAHVHEWVTEAEAKLQQLDQEMNWPAQGPRLSLDPPGYASQPLRPVTRSRIAIQQDKDTLKAQVYQRVEKETEQAPAKIQQASRDIAFGRLYQEEIAQLATAPSNGFPRPAAQWTIDDTQVKIMAYAKEARDQKRGTGRSNRPEPVRAEPAGQSMPKPEWTAADRAVETPPVTNVSDPTPAYEAPAEPGAADVSTPDWEPER